MKAKYESTKITINKIAELAGVSRGTVDKVIHNRPGLSETLRLRVQNEIRSSGYQIKIKTSRSPRSRRPIRLAVLMPHPSDPYYAGVEKGILDSIQRNSHLKIAADFKYYDESDLSAATILPYGLYSRRYDGVIAKGWDSLEWTRHINRLSAKGKIIILIDSDSKKSNQLCSIGENRKHVGQIAANLLCNGLPKSGKVTIIAGSGEIQAQSQQIDGFSEYIKEYYPKMKVACVFDTHDQPSRLYEKMREILNLQPDLDGIFNVAGFSDKISQAISDSGIKKHIRYVNWNFSPDVKALIHTGIIDYALGILPQNQGGLAIDTMIKAILYGEKPQSIIHMPIHIGMSANIDTLLE